MLSIVRFPLVLSLLAAIAALPAHAATPLEEFTLQTHTGTDFTVASLRGRWTLLSFGFTHCPDVCPATLATLARGKHDLADAAGAPLQVVFISVDPARDTPELLAGYVTYFDPEFLGVTGSHAQLDRLERQLGTTHRLIAAREGYQVQHAAALYLIDPQGRPRAQLSPPFRPAQIAERLAALREDS